MHIYIYIYIYTTSLSTNRLPTASANRQTTTSSSSLSLSLSCTLISSLVVVVVVVVVVLVLVVFVPKTPSYHSFGCCLCCFGCCRRRRCCHSPHRHCSYLCSSYFGRGDDMVGNPHRAQICQFDLFELNYHIDELRHPVPCRAIRGNSISVNSALPP